MTEQPTEFAGACPTWCRNSVEADAARAGGQSVDGVHAHVSEDTVVGDLDDPMVVRMIQLAGSELVKVVVGHKVVDVAEAQSLAHALLRLTAAVEPAAPGLGFVELLAARSGAGTSELALAAGLDVERVRAQRSGGQVLSVAEFDRLALAAAQLVPPWSAAVEDHTPEADPVEERGTDETELSAVADMNELAVLAEGPDES